MSRIPRGAEKLRAGLYAYRGFTLASEEDVNPETGGARRWWSIGGDDGFAVPQNPRLLTLLGCCLWVDALLDHGDGEAARIERLNGA